MTNHVATFRGTPIGDMTREQLVDAVDTLAGLLDAQRGLLCELRTARPLLMYGEPWINRIDAVISKDTA